MERIELDRMEVDSSGALGPGKRVILWLHGCHRHCPGCIARDWNDRPESAMRLSVALLAEVILSTPSLEGVTISGGEPFLQAGALRELLRRLRGDGGPGVIIYTGYRLEELDSETARAVLAMTDTLIDGDYRQALDDGGPHRGSSNQVIHALTPRYSAYYADASRGRNQAIRFHGGEYTLTGIPDAFSRALWARLKDAEQAAASGEC